jgi:hypothetical protein
MTNPQLRATRPIYLELSELMEAMGCHKAALENEVLANSKQFRLNNYNEWRHVESGESPAEWAKGIPQRSPHWLEGYIQPELTEAEEAKKIIRDATETPSTKTLHALYRYFGEAKASEIIKAANVDVARMKPGTRKLNVGDDGKTTVEEIEQSTDARSKNPWSRHYVGPKGQRGPNATAQCSLVKAIGVEKAAAIARAARSFIGATRAYD